MLRAALPLSRRAVFAPITSRLTSQWQSHLPPVFVFTRALADTRKPSGDTKPNIHNSDAIVLPGSQSRTATAATPSPPGPVAPTSPGRTPAATPGQIASIPADDISLTPPPPEGRQIGSIAADNVPLTPLPPREPAQDTQLNSIPTPETKASSSNPPLPPPSISSLPSSPSPPPPKKKPRRFRRFLLYLTVLTGLGFAGGVWYSLVSDNFHDFFTEYIPFGEDAVLYFEEREFRRRFPRATSPTNRPTAPRDTGHKITIPSKSGLSWKVSEDDSAGSDLGKKGRHMSALEENKPSPSVEHAQTAPADVTSAEKVKAVDAAKKAAPSSSAVASSATTADAPQTPPSIEQSSKSEAAPKSNASIPAESSATTGTDSQAGPVPKPPTPSIPSSKTESAKARESSKASVKSPEVDEPSVFVPITRIDGLKINNAEEPLVQDLVKILNDIITVVNADNSNGKFNSTISKAKGELAGVGKRILELKAAERAAAEQKIKATQGEFDKAAKELVLRLEDEMRDQEARWKDEFESEREKISQSYEQRLNSEVERAKQISEKRVNNQLLEQAITLKKQFATDVRDRVESERDGRLSKLSELADSVDELEKLTTDWNSVIDANLKAQHLQVAVEAVRAGLDHADRPRPFIKELAALKEIAADDSVVNSAIASINPTAYQLGVPTSAQLIDRFRRVASEVRKASLLPEDAGLASHAASVVLSKVLFKKHGRAVGDDVESVLTRTETLLEEGNLDEAAREMNTLTGWAKTLSGDWLGEVRRTLEVRQALDVISTEARLQSLKVD
ncbi:Formation of crista junctions protein 1 [Xylographa opegraphella]|nr:Formation of crista junctions protein 1 [Xylographa opegraphella]